MEASLAIAASSAVVIPPGFGMILDDAAFLSRPDITEYYMWREREGGGEKTCRLSSNGMPPAEERVTSINAKMQISVTRRDVD